MFDVSFSELLLIGVIALIVIGPERLPKVARTIGHLVGRAQRYVNDVKTDIQREMNVDEITSLKGQMEEAANTVKSSIAAAGDTLRNPIDEAKEALQDAQSSLKEATESVNAALNPAQPTQPEQPEQLEQLGQPEQLGQSAQTVQPAQAEQPEQPEQLAQPAQSAPDLMPAEVNVDADAKVQSEVDTATLPLPGMEDPNPLASNPANKPSTGTPT